MTSPDALYEALGVNRGAPIEVIRKAYRKASKRAHPDGGGTPEQWALVTLAHDILTDAKKRKTYDETGGADELEAAALQAAYDAISLVASAIVNMRKDVTSFDILGDAVKTLRQQIANVDDAQRQQRKARDAVQTIRARIRPKKGANMLDAVLDQGHRRAEAAFAMQRDICKCAISILQSHTFEYVAPYDIW